MSIKKRVLTSLEKLRPDLRKLLNMMYPEGYEEYLVKLENHKGESIFALPLETEDAIFLVKISSGTKLTAGLELEDDDEAEDGIEKDVDEFPDGEFEGEEGAEEEEDDSDGDGDDGDDGEDDDDDDDDDGGKKKKKAKKEKKPAKKEAKPAKAKKASKPAPAKKKKKKK